MGQIGLGKGVRKVDVPRRVIRPEEQEDYDLEQKLKTQKFRYVFINGRRRKIATDKVIIKKNLPPEQFYVAIQAGYSHSMAITSKFLYVYLIP